MKKIINYRGLVIRVENPAGSTRSGVDPETKKPWSITMAYDYGEIKGSMGVDGDPVDCFIGPNKYAKFVYVIHQTTKQSGEWDEDKCMLGFSDAMAAKRAYEKCYDQPDHFYGSIETIPFKVFKKKVMSTEGLPQMIHASGFTKGAPVTVDGFHGRGVVQYIKKNRIFVQFRNGLIISRAPNFVHEITSDYKSRYMSGAREKRKASKNRKPKKGSVGEAMVVPEDDTVTHHAYKTVKWGVDPETGDIFPPDNAQTEKTRKIWRDMVHKENMSMTTSIAAGGEGSGRHKSTLDKRQAIARQEYRRMYKLAKQAGHKEDSARDVAIEAYLNKFKTLRAGGQGSGRRKKTQPAQMSRKEWLEQSQTLGVNRQVLEAGLEDVEMEGPMAHTGKGIKKVGTQFCVRTNGVDKNLGCFPSREQATAVKQGKSFIEPLLPKQMQNALDAPTAKEFHYKPIKLKKPKMPTGGQSVGHRLPNKSGKSGFKTRSPNPSFDAYADYGEPMAGAQQHAHLDPKVWFHPPSLKKPDHVPADDPGETNDKYLDVTKRKTAHKDRMKLLKRSAPAGNPPQIPARTTLLTPHSAVYQPGMFATSMRRKRRNGGMFRAFEAASI